MAYEGDINPSAILDIKFVTTAAATGAPTTLAGTPAISVYKDNSTTQSTAGVSLTVDFDSVTGLNNVRVDTSADGTFYSAASNFQIIITTGTVGGTSAVGYVVSSFSIQNRSPLRPVTAGNTISVDGSGRVDVIKVAGTTQTARDLGASVLLSTGTGTGQLDFTSGVVKANTTQFAGQTVTAAAGVTLPTSVASPTNITAGTITTATNLTNAPTSGDFTATMKTSLNAATPASVTGAVASVTGNVGGNVTGSVGSVVGAVGSVTGAVGSVTGNIGGNVVGSVASVTAPVSITAGQLFIKKNTQITVTFPMTDSTTHLPATGLTVTARRTIDGAAVGACANAVTELSLGLYSLVLAAADVNGTQITLALSATGADTRWIGLVTQA